MVDGIVGVSGFRSVLALAAVQSDANSSRTSAVALPPCCGAAVKV
jgi:hypothetical protein